MILNIRAALGELLEDSVVLMLLPSTLGKL